jgi:hypothetical protein
MLMLTFVNNPIQKSGVLRFHYTNNNLADNSTAIKNSYICEKKIADLGIIL